MAVAIEMEFKGATLDQYDQVLEKMGLTPGGATPPGAIAHWAAEVDGGLHVVDVWESQEAFDQFSAEQIGPYGAEVGWTEPPETRTYQVHSFLTRA